jgi:hypothetical protein
VGNGVGTGVGGGVGDGVGLTAGFGVGIGVCEKVLGIFFFATRQYIPASEWAEQASADQ